MNYHSIHSQSLSPSPAKPGRLIRIDEHCDPHNRIYKFGFLCILDSLSTALLQEGSEIMLGDSGGHESLSLGARYTVLGSALGTGSLASQGTLYESPTEEHVTCHVFLSLGGTNTEAKNT